MESLKNLFKEIKREQWKMYTQGKGVFQLYIVALKDTMKLIT